MKALIPFAAVTVLASGADAFAQTGQKEEGSASEMGPRVEEPPISPPQEGAPMEFPGVTQGGVVSATPASSFERPWATQRNFALFATEGSFSGFGLGVRSGWLRLGWDASFAFVPVFATYSPDQDTLPDIEILSSFLGSATMYIGLHRLDARTDLGIAFGYKYSTLLQHGASVAFYFQRELGAHWTLQGFVGPCIFPQAEDRIRERTGWVAGWAGGSVLSGLAWHQAGVGASLAFFP